MLASAIFTGHQAWPEFVRQCRRNSIQKSIDVKQYYSNNQLTTSVLFITIFSMIVIKKRFPVILFTHFLKTLFFCRTCSKVLWLAKHLFRKYLQIILPVPNWIIGFVWVIFLYWISEKVHVIFFSIRLLSNLPRKSVPILHFREPKPYKY